MNIYRILKLKQINGDFNNLYDIEYDLVSLLIKSKVDETSANITFTHYEYEESFPIFIYYKHSNNFWCNTKIVTYLSKKHNLDIKMTELFLFSWFSGNLKIDKNKITYTNW